MKRALVEALIVATIAAGSGPAAAAELTVDLAHSLKPVDHAASGALYGIAAKGRPPLQWISGIHPRNFTQMAPGGGQLPNGESRPVGDALVVAPIAAAAGASVTIRLPDTFAAFPYQWKGDAFWQQALDRVARAVVAANPPNIYGYEIWNEPDWTWKPQWGAFDKVWADSVHRLRAIDPRRHVVGPSLSRWNGDWMRSFLSAAKASDTLPDIVSWHELDPRDANDIEAHIAAYRGLERDLGIAARPISINEYGSPRAMGDPGRLVHYIGQLERAGVDSADLAFWHRPGRLSDLLAPREGGIGPANDPVATGAYWLYAWYGAMAGKMVSARSDEPAGFDAIAAYDAAGPIVRIIFGGAAGEHTVRVTDLTGFGTTADVDAQITHWTGTDGEQAAPEGLMTANVAIVNAAASFNLPPVLASDAVEVTLKPASADATLGSTKTSGPATTRYEAEAGQVTAGRVFTINMAPDNLFANAVSGNGYVGLYNSETASLKLPVEAPSAGPYRLRIGYSNGNTATLRYILRIPGRPDRILEFPPTQGRELIGLLGASIELPEGATTLTLAAPERVSGMLGTPSLIEFDFFDLTPAPGR